MNFPSKVFCRTYQLGFRLAMPVLPYREPKLYEHIKSKEGYSDTVFKKSKLINENQIEIIQNWISPNKFFKCKLLYDAKQKVAVQRHWKRFCRRIRFTVQCMTRPVPIPRYTMWGRQRHCIKKKSVKRSLHLGAVLPWTVPKQWERALHIQINP